MAKQQSQSGNRKRLQLILPLAALACVAGLIVAMRFYDAWPVKPVPCALRSLTGIPCLSCGATRSLKSFSEGRIATALSFNPLVVIALGAVPIWLALAMIRAFRGRETAPRRWKLKTRWVVAAAVVLVASNWVYLILYLPE